MTKKIIPLLIVLICSLCFLGLVWAENNTTGNLSSTDIEDLSNYIIPVYITDNGIEFSDGFIGFSIDSSKAPITTDDHFTSEPTKNDDIENHIKLAIIEAYKAGKENNLGDIVQQVINENKEYDVVQAVFNSTETIGDSAVVNIDNTTEATFTFELLKDKEGSASDCLAYKVSLKTVKSSDVLGANNDSENGSDQMSAAGDAKGDNSANQKADDKTAENSADQKAADTNKSDDKTAENTNEDKNESGDGQTIINQTNKTIINKTNTTIINENNTTIINKENTKVVNKTDDPQNATAQQKIMRTVGNPIFLLIVVIVIIAVAAVVIRRRN